MRSIQTALASAVALLLTLIMGCSLGEEDALQRIRKRGDIKIAVSSGYAPFSFYNSRRELIGFDIDMATGIAGRLGVKASFIDVPWQSIMEGLRNGNYDAVVSSMAITDERTTQAAFSEPYYYSRMQLFVKKDSKHRKISDLQGKILGCTTATTNEIEARKLNPRRVVLYPNDEEAMQQLVTGRIDAVITDEISGMYSIKYRRLSIEPLGGALRSERIAVAVRKEDQVLLKAINDVLKEMRRKGDIRKLIEKTAEGRY